MLHENLAKVRKERGLTQESMAIKLNIARQTVSKWENGIAVPDADMLCRIADVLDVSVAELLGVPESGDKDDTASIANSLAEINEQLAVRNRRSSNTIRVILGSVIGLFLLMLVEILVVLNVLPGAHSIRNSVENVDVGEIIELDENEIPVLKQINASTEHAIREYFGSRSITEKQLIQSWGSPERQTDESASWVIDEDRVITVHFNDENYAYSCGIESR